jgi:hypothetical protein
VEHIATFRIECDYIVDIAGDELLFIPKNRKICPVRVPNSYYRKELPILVTDHGASHPYM